MQHTAWVFFLGKESIFEPPILGRSPSGMSGGVAQTHKQLPKCLSPASITLMPRRVGRANHFQLYP